VSVLQKALTSSNVNLFLFDFLLISIVAKPASSYALLRPSWYRKDFYDTGTCKTAIRACNSCLVSATHMNLLSAQTTSGLVCSN
jgi:hypothetical protein